jgi:hypothetical protein
VLETLLLQSLQSFSFADANEAMSFKDDAATGKSAVLSCLEPRQDHPEQHQRQKERGGKGQAEAERAEYHTRDELGGGDCSPGDQRFIQRSRLGTTYQRPIRMTNSAAADAKPAAEASNTTRAIK